MTSTSDMTERTTIELDASEMAVVQMLAAMRHGMNRGQSVVNSRVGPQSDYQTDLDGLIAEFAFCRWKNVWPDMSIAPRSGGADCVVDGKTIDVKATRRAEGRLLAVTTKNVQQADIYVLAIVRDNSVTFAGWAFANELIKPENIINLGHGPTYALDQSRLRVFKS